MKKIFAKPHNLLFAASTVILLQFIISVIYFFMQAIVYHAFNDWSYPVFIVYCLTVCTVTGLFIMNNREGNKSFDYVKMWFAGFFLYAFCEILLFIKMIYIEYSDELISVSNLWDNQHLFRLYLCIAVIFVIYCVLFIFEKQKLYIGFALSNLFLLCLFIVFVPEIGDFLLYGDENIFEVILVQIIREAGILIFMINMFVFALHEFYNYKEK